MTSLLAFLLPLTLYLCFPSTMWNFDGVACAAALELGRPFYLFHANHLLYGFLGFLFWNFAGITAGMSRALPALQLFTSLLSAAGLVGLYRSLRLFLPGRWPALLLTLSLSMTAAFWVWSIEAQVYALGFLALSWATFFLIGYEGRAKYVLTGLLHGAAILGHVMHGLWVVPALYWIGREKTRRFPAMRDYLVSAGLMTILPYILVLRLVIAPGRSSQQVLIWLKGSAGLTLDRRWAWHWPGWSGPWVWLKSTLPSLWGGFWPYENTAIAGWTWAVVIISISIFALCVARSLARRADPLARFCGLWLAAYGLFLSTWEPMTLCYRMTDIIPLGLLLTLGIREWKPLVQKTVMSVFAASLLSVNLVSRVIPMSHTEQNPVYQETLTLSKMTSPHSLYITEGGLPWMYILYFTGRMAWNARAFTPDLLANEIARQKQNRPVLAQSSALQSPEMQANLKKLKIRQTEAGLRWLQLN